jgi:serine/threonine protein kinase
MPVTAPTSAVENFGPYQLLELVAQGGMSRVYRARRKGTTEEVALKVATEEVAGNAILCRRLEREFRTARSLNHPNLVRALDFALEGSVPYLVMELVKGESLGDRIEREGKLAEDRAVPIIVQVADALQLLHQRGYIHRDVKPDNILLPANGVAKLTDLGLVKALDADVQLTQGAGMLGTPNSMAPEQFEDARKVDRRTDVHALGATLYMAVTGVLPFSGGRGRNYLAVLKKKLTNDIAPPRQLVPTLSEAADFAIRRALRADPAQRQASCREFAEALTGSSVPEVKGRTRPRDASRPRRTERRAAVRYATELASTCQPVTRLKEETWKATIQDISERGVGLHLPRRFEPGTFLVLDLHSKDGRTTRNLLLRVVRARRLSPGKWLAGCELLYSLSAAELKELL